MLSLAFCGSVERKPGNNTLTPAPSLRLGGRHCGCAMDGLGSSTKVHQNTSIAAFTKHRSFEPFKNSRPQPPKRTIQKIRYTAKPFLWRGGEESCLKKRFLRTIWSHHFSSSPLLSSPILFSSPFPSLSSRITRPARETLLGKYVFQIQLPGRGNRLPPLSPPLPSPVGNERLELSCARAAGKCGNSGCGCGGIKEGTA